MDIVKIKSLIQPFINQGNYEYCIDLIFQLCGAFHQYDIELKIANTKLEMLQSEYEEYKKQTNHEEMYSQCEKLKEDNNVLKQNLELCKKELDMIRKFYIKTT